MKHLLIILSLLSSILLQSCSEGFVLVEKSESFNKNKPLLKSKKIIYIAPYVDAYYVREDAERDYKLILEKQTELMETLPKVAKAKGFQAEFVKKTEHTEAYINLMQRLEQDIYTAIRIQDHPLNRAGQRSYSSNSQKVYVYAPTFSPEYSSLTNEFDTPLYAVSGVFSVDAKPKTRKANAFVRENSNINKGRYYYFYNIIVDVNSAQVIYREIKKVEEPLKSTTLRVVLHDSFAVLKSNVTK
jgi:hypothetical protein